VCLGHRRASGRGSPDKKLLFWGDRNGGARTGTVREQSRSFAVAGRRKSPEAVPRHTGRTGTRPNRSPPYHSQAQVLSQNRNPNHGRIASSFWKLAPVFPKVAVKGGRSRDPWDSHASCRREVIRERNSPATSLGQTEPPIEIDHKHRL
jgi:hypothetical protein